MEYVDTTGRLYGKRAGGRQREKMLHSLLLFHGKMAAQQAESRRLQDAWKQDTSVDKILDGGDDDDDYHDYDDDDDYDIKNGFLKQEKLFSRFLSKMQ